MLVTIARHINTLYRQNVKGWHRPVIAINNTCTLTSRSRLESYKRLVSVSSRLVKPTSRSRLGLGRWASRSRAFTSRAHPCQMTTGRAWNEMQWFKVHSKTTRSQLSLTHHANKSSRWAENPAIENAGFACWSCYEISPCSARQLTLNNGYSFVSYW